MAHFDVASSKLAIFQSWKICLLLWEYPNRRQCPISPFYLHKRQFQKLHSRRNRSLRKCFVSYLFNIFHFSKMASASHFVYFYASLGFLLGRILAVSLYLSEVNECSREPLGVFKQVPKEAYYAEVGRFWHEIAVDNLPDLQYFNVTRGLVLTVRKTCHH